MTDGPRKRHDGVDEGYQAAWQRTREELDALADDLEADGWDVTTVVADETIALPRDAGDADDFGLSYLVPGNHADRLESALADADLHEYRVFRRAVEGRVFVVTQLTDADNGTAVLLAGTYDDGTEDRVADAASEEGATYTHVRRLDGTAVASFRHEDWELFFPEAGDTDGDGDES